MKVGVLTGGGDCPGLNAVIRAVARRSFQRGHEVVGVRDGWRGLVVDELEPLGPREISGILPRGGTILAKEEHHDLYAAIDLAIDKVERQITKQKEKIKLERRKSNP